MPWARDHQPTDASASALHLTIHGRVQGVGFRWSMCEFANDQGLRGWVRNRRDGSVEAVAIGRRVELDALCDWAGRGPRGAAVDRVAERPAKAEEVALAGPNFSMLPSA